jgi:peptidoglycan/LPS O-acetylase OafA/YrhL
MSVENASGLIALLVLSVGIAWMVHRLIRKSIRTLLDDVLGLPAATTFYTRTLTIGIFFIALAAALVPFDLKKDAAFMEYVWRIANGLSSTFSGTCLFLIGYLTLVTILVATLRRRHEQ